MWQAGRVLPAQFAVMISNPGDFDERTYRCCRARHRAVPCAWGGAGRSRHRALHGREDDGAADLLPAKQCRIPPEDNRQADARSPAKARCRQPADRRVEGDSDRLAEGDRGFADRAQATGGRYEGSAGEGRERAWQRSCTGEEGQVTARYETRYFSTTSLSGS